MHRHRPTVPERQPGPLPTGLDKAHGFLWWCEQSALMFGADRRQPTAARMTLTLEHGLQLSAVLPATTKPNPDFYALDPARMRTHRPQDARASWLCPRYETLSNEHLKPAGIVDQTTRVRILGWLQTKPGEPA